MQVMRSVGLGLHGMLCNLSDDSWTIDDVEPEPPGSGGATSSTEGGQKVHTAVLNADADACA